MNTKRQTRRQATADKAYWLVRDYMINRGLIVNPIAESPLFCLESYVYAFPCPDNAKGVYYSKAHVVVVRHQTYDTEDMYHTLLHEMVHANQILTGYDYDIPHKDRPEEIEAYKIASELMHKRRKK